MVYKSFECKLLNIENSFEMGGVLTSFKHKHLALIAFHLGCATFWHESCCAMYNAHDNPYKFGL
jgi:hypothetical protein